MSEGFATLSTPASTFGRTVKTKGWYRTNRFLGVNNAKFSKTALNKGIYFKMTERWMRDSITTLKGAIEKFRRGK